MAQSYQQRFLPETREGMAAFLISLAAKVPYKYQHTLNPQAQESSSPNASTSNTRGRASQQPSKAALKILGIKVRDFAYESTLPPIAPVYYFPRQHQPDPRTYKRPRIDDDDNDPFASNSQGLNGREPFKKSKLERQDTEPLESDTNYPVRERGFANLEDYSSQQTYSQSQAPAQYLSSQESEPYIDTPLVTPNGSLQWPIVDTSTIPVSQLDAEFETSVPEMLSYSQLGFANPDQSPQAPYDQSIPSNASSPLSSPPSSQILPASPSPAQRKYPPQNQFSNNFHSSSSFQSPSSMKPPTPLAVSPRYQLRSRTKSTSSPRPLGKSSQRRPPLRSQGLPHLLSRPSAISKKSLHARSKLKSGTVSPSSRVLRKRGSTGTVLKTRGKRSAAV